MRPFRDAAAGLRPTPHVRRHATFNTTPNHNHAVRMTAALHANNCLIVNAGSLFIAARAA
jgi:hypothetical protein